MDGDVTVTPACLTAGTPSRGWHVTMTSPSIHLDILNIITLW